MKINRHILLPFGMLMMVFALNAVAAEDRYVMCKRMAKQETGYIGPVPTVYAKKANVLKSVAKGALLGGFIGKISGNSSKKGAQGVAALAGLGALIKHDKAKKKARRENEKNRKLREAYSVELNACMAG